MAMGDEIRRARLQKLERIKKSGVSPYPVTPKRTHTIGQALADFESLSADATECIIAGRLRQLREHGKATFGNIEEETGQIQLYVRQDRIGDQQYQSFLDVVDIGDILQIRGTLFLTKKGEKTLDVSSWRVLAKSLLPLPEKWHGIQDVEERYRKRYLDLLFNPGIKKVFRTRAKLVSELRRFLEEKGFMEVETPILQPLYGGAEAAPFTTHLNAFDMDMYLRIAPELYLKRLIVGGFEKVYEIGRVFRNEGVDRSHNPDFTMLEFYWAYADDKDMMGLIEELFLHIVGKLTGGNQIQYEGETITFTMPFERVEYAALLKRHAKVDIETENQEALFAKAGKLGVRVEKSFDKWRIVDEIYKKYCRPKLIQPTFVIHHPTGFIPLAKPLDEHPETSATIQLVVAGWEMVKAYAELNDPILQRSVFEEQEGLFKKGLQEAQRMDTDFVEALEYGMPPTAGFGMGIDRICALLTNSHSLREVILFPTMKPRD